MSQSRRERNLALLGQSTYGGRSSARATDISAYLNKGESTPVTEGAKKKRKGLPRFYAKTINAALPEVLFHDDGSVEFRWHGARLMTYNELLHVTSYVLLTPYKKACHNAVAQAVMITPRLKNFTFPGRVDIRQLRRANADVDPDAVTAMFKFFTDGLCKAGVLNDDTKRFIRYIEPVQETGDFMVSYTIKPVAE